MAKLTKDIVNQRLEDAQSSVRLIGEYIRGRTKTECQCQTCGYVWDALPENLLRGSGCPSCYGNVPLTKQIVNTRLENMGSSLRLVGPYVNVNTNSEFQCIYCGLEFYTKPAHPLAGHGCRSCNQTGNPHNPMLTKSEVNRRLEEQDRRVRLVGSYTGAGVETTYECLSCGHEWEAKPNNIATGKGCPKCKISRGERAVAQVLDNYSIEYEIEKKFKGCRYKKRLPFDFFLPSYNACIEYQGIQHYEPVDVFGGEEKLRVRQIRDQVKRDFCLENGIYLLEIPYTEFDRIEEILTGWLSL